MKISIALSVFILAIGLATGFRHQQQLETLHGERGELAARAVKLGITVASSGTSADTKFTKRQRADTEKQTRGFAADFALFAKEMEQQEKSGDTENEAFRRRAMEMTERMMALEPDQLRVVIAQLRENRDISDETRRNMIGYSVMLLSENHPAAALALVAESADLMEDGDIGRQVISTSLAKLAKEDPRTALKWLRDNAEKHPEIADDEAKCSILAGAAKGDPKQAFKLMREIGLTDDSGAIEAIIDSGKTPDQRAGILAAFREHLATISDESQRDALREEALGGIARTISGESFEAVTGWVSAQKLSPEESVQFVAGLSYDATRADTGKWIDWMTKTLPAEELGERVGDLVAQWTQQDYQAAGKWLAAEPDGPAKTASVRSYAETVAEYEPKVAAQWAMTLPAGDERQEALKSIYENWPENDAAAAAAFAAEHGLKEEENDATEEDP